VSIAQNLIGFTYNYVHKCNAMSIKQPQLNVRPYEKVFQLLLSYITQSSSDSSDSLDNGLEGQGIVV